MTIVHAVVSGIVRSELETRLVFRELLEARDNGIIGRIVFVTWDDHLEKQAPLKEFLVRHGIDVLGIPFPDKAPTVANIQMVQLYSGLSFFDDDDIVLRVRIDKVFPALRTFTSRANTLLERSQQTDEPTVFKGKVIIEALGMNDIFGHADFIMIARAGDLRQMVNMDNYFLVFTNDPSAEAEWYSIPFIRSYASIRAIFEGIIRTELCLTLKKWATDEILVMPDILSRILAYYLDLCRRNYILLNDNILPPELTLRSAIGGKDPTGWDWGVKTFIRSNEWFMRFKTGFGCEAFNDYLPLYASGKLAAPKPTMNDMNKIREFIAQTLNKDIGDMWPGSAFGSSKLFSGDTAPLRTPTYQDIFQESLAALGVDLNHTQLTPILAGVSELLTKYPAGTYYEFCTFLENLANTICGVITQIPPALQTNDMRSLPGLLFCSALAFSWSTPAAEWLCQALIEDKIPTSFGPTVNWAVLARIKYQSPYVVFLTGVLLLKGIGMASNPTEALRLITTAAEAGSSQAKAFLEATKLTG